jgi:fatty-acyl-CoA synthase
VEEALYRHPAVEIAAVVAMPHEKWGETPCAFVELGAGETVDADTLRVWCKKQLAPYKVPGRFVFMPIPRTSTGKIQKFILREQAKGIAHNATADHKSPAK